MQKGIVKFSAKKVAPSVNFKPHSLNINGVLLLGSPSSTFLALLSANLR